MPQERSRRIPWAEEERILVLDLYFRMGCLGKTHPDVVELCRVLNALKVDSYRQNAERVRTPGTIAARLRNFAWLDPDFDGGAPRVAQRDREVWDRFKSNRDALAATAVAIRKDRGQPADRHEEPNRTTPRASPPKALFIMTWNPPNWDISPEEYESRVMKTARGHTVREPWSTGGRKSGIAVGDEVVLFRQGAYRGLIASGHATSEIGLSDDGRHRVGVAWETWVQLEDRLPVEILRECAPRFKTAVRASGEKLSPEQATTVRQHWADWLGQPTALSGDEAGALLDGSPIIAEGAKARVVVNRYERSRRAREACLAHHGYACNACGLRFEERYGEIGRGFIHVHHITPMAQVADDPGYKLNPVEDLVPVCPNCHAMLHSSSSKTLTVEELRDRIRRASEAGSE